MGSIRTKSLFIVIIALVMLTAACGGKSAEEQLLEEIMENSGEDIGDVDISVDEEGENFSINVQGEDGEDISISGSGDDETFEMTVEGEDGEVMTFGGGEVPDDLTVPYPPGGDVTGTFSSETDVTVALMYPRNEFDSLVSFYDDALKSGSDDVERTESSFSSEEGDQRSVFWFSSNGDFQVSVTDCYGLEGELDSACVSIFETK
jgi:hypothetical protein